MKEKVIRYGITIEVETVGPAIYILGKSIEEVQTIFYKIENLTEEMKTEAIEILKKAQACNASLREIRNIRENRIMRISFEFEVWEDFLNFNEIMNSPSQK